MAPAPAPRQIFAFEPSWNEVRYYSNLGVVFQVRKDGERIHSGLLDSMTCTLPGTARSQSVKTDCDDEFRNCSFEEVDGILSNGPG